MSSSETNQLIFTVIIDKSLGRIKLQDILLEEGECDGEKLQATLWIATSNVHLLFQNWIS